MERPSIPNNNPACYSCGITATRLRERPNPQTLSVTRYPGVLCIASDKKPHILDNKSTHNRLFCPKCSSKNIRACGSIESVYNDAVTSWNLAQQENGPGPSKSARIARMYAEELEGAKAIYIDSVVCSSELLKDGGVDLGRIATSVVAVLNFTKAQKPLERDTAPPDKKQCTRNK